MKNFIITLVILVAIFPSKLFAQLEASNWITGKIDMWIIMNDSGPVAYSPPGNTDLVIDFFESSGFCSSVSDAEGNLLLYTNGDMIGNSDLLFPAGNIMGLQLGSSLIVPKPGNNNRFYILATTFPHFNQSGYPMSWKEFDITFFNGQGGTASSGSLGNGIIRKLSATYHANGRDIWILSHEWGNNAFKAWLLTDQGITPNPVVSHIGSVQQDTVTVDPCNSAAWGKIRFSPGGNYVAMSSVGLDLVEVFKFDKQTGTLSDSLALSIDRPFSIEFSSNGTYLYFAQYFKCYYIGCNAPYVDSIPVYQANILSGNQTAFINSSISVSHTSQHVLTHQGPCIQLAHNGKIYYTPTMNHLSVINEPNKQGAESDWEDLAYIFPSGYPGNGPIQQFPNFFIPYLDFNIRFENQCFGDTSMIYTLTNQGFDSIRWEFADTVAGLNFSIANQDTVFHTFSEPGSYDISLKRYRDGMLDELSKRLFIDPEVYITLIDDTLICEGEEATFAVTDTFCNFAWVNDFSSDTIYSDSVTIAQEGMWWPIVSNFYGHCGSIDTIEAITQPDLLDLGPDAAPNCINNPVVLDAAQTGNCAYLWSSGDTTDNILAVSDGYYSVTVQQNHCTVYDTILLVYDDPIQINLGDSLTFCDSLEVEIAAGDFPADFLWSPGGQTTSSIMVNSPGLYTVTASNGCGTEIVSTLINLYETPVVDLGTDDTICSTDNVYIQNLQQGAFEPGIFSWSTGDSLSQISVSGAGAYSLSFTNVCGSDADTVYYGMDYPPIADLGNDTVICEGTSITIGTQSLGDYLWYPNGETTQSITVWDADNYVLVVSNTCGTVSDAISISLDIPLPVDLGPDQVICTGDSMSIENTLSLPPDAGIYTWNTGDSTETVSALQSGIYTLSISNACGIFTDSMYLQVDTALSINLGNDTTICLGDPLFLSTTTSVFNTYLWSTGESSTSITVYDAGQYGLSVTNTCGTYSDSLLLATHENAFAFPFDTLWLNVGDTIDAGPGYASYLWWNGSTTQGIAALDSGLHWIEVTDIMGCNGSDSVWVNFPDGISSPSSLSGIKVYPNPVKDVLIIEFGSTDYKSAPAFRLWNSLGQEVSCAIAPSGCTGSQVTLDTSALPKGIYLLSISQGNEKTVVKVVKE